MKNSTKKHLLYKFSLFLIIPFFGFYTVKLGFSPIYLTFLASVLLLIFAANYGVRLWEPDSLTLLASSLLFYAVFLYAVEWQFESGTPSAWVNYIFSLAYFFVAALAVKNSRSGQVLNASEYAVVFSLILLGAELFYRLAHPSTAEELGHENRDDIFWYVYKTSSFMYPDSNSVGLFASCLFIFTFQLARYCQSSFNKYLIPISLIVLGSLSRAAILSTVIVFVYIFVKNRNARLFLFLSLGIAVVFLLSTIKIEDDSLESKFWIAGLVIQYLDNCNFLSLLVGVGPGNAQRVLDVGAHLLPATLLVEIGVLGTVLNIVLWYFIYRRNRQLIGPLFFVFILNGFSFTTLAVPWLYGMAVVLMSLKNVNLESLPAPFRRHAGWRVVLAKALSPR